MSPLHLRPHGATVLAIVVWVVLGLLAVEALLSAGVRGLGVVPGLALIAGLIWLLLWAPRVVLHEEEVEVRNILTTHHLPFAAITAVRLGAMLRLDTRAADGAPRTISAWNAPGIGRDNPLARAGRDEPGAGGTDRRRRLSRGERLRRDQERSRSAVVRDRWESWAERQGDEPAAAADGTAIPTTSVNVREIVVLGVLIGLVALRVAL